MTMLTMDMPERSSRWLLIGSLALNLFFIGTIGALAVRHSFAPAQPAAPDRPRTASAPRSEERRGGKECRSRRSPYH